MSSSVYLSYLDRSFSNITPCSVYSKIYANSCGVMPSAYLNVSLSNSFNRLLASIKTPLNKAATAYRYHIIVLAFCY